MILFDKVQNNLKNVREHGWQTLNLRNCGLTKIPKEVFEFDYLVNLDLSNDSFCEEEFKNCIELIPDDIVKLRLLKRLNIAENSLTQINERIVDLQYLNYLNLSNNKISAFTPKVANMKSLKELYIEDNPFELLPPEIAKKGIDQIRNFYKEIEKKDYLYEVKLILVGQGRVGKTCLSDALTNESYKLNERERSTEGININSWVIPQEEIGSINPNIKRDFQINIWDFGGQEIYHSTHQFFLTKRSLYMLVTESRKEDSHDEFYYWLNIIKLLGDKSPVILVLNKCDQPTKDLPINEYKDVFSNIESFHKVSLKPGWEPQFREFRETLKSIASNLPHIGNPLPKVWVDIRHEIEGLKQTGINYISLKDYLQICKNHYRNKDSALYLSDYFHDLGVIMHFQDDYDLKDIVILNHKWVTTGVYKILDDREVIEKNGRFSFQDIERILSNEEYRYRTRELLSLMKNRKFDLCFELPDGEFLIPRLLPVDEVEHSWKSAPGNLRFELRYKFMPKGIITRLIVKLNGDIYKDKYWRYGVILLYDGTQAFIRERYFENKLTIEIQGGNAREYLFIIRKEIQEIHKDYNNVKVCEMVPCNCKSCGTSNNPMFYDFNLLQRYEIKEISEIRCDKSLDMVNVASLTNDLIRKKNPADKIIACENRNVELLEPLELDNCLFFAERDSSTVFIQVMTKPEWFGLRDRDFLLDSEIVRIRKAYKNYRILEYYCLENYLYHPDNIDELGLENFKIDQYRTDIVAQKNLKKMSIISNFKSARKSYQEFKIERSNFFDKSNENDIIKYLDSDNIETFFKAFSMKDQFNKQLLSPFGLTDKKLASTKWFKNKISNIIDFI